MHVCIIPPFAAILISCEKVFEVNWNFDEEKIYRLKCRHTQLCWHTPHSIYQERRHERMAHINQFSDVQPWNSFNESFSSSMYTWKKTGSRTKAPMRFEILHADLTNHDTFFRVIQLVATLSDAYSHQSHMKYFSWGVKSLNWQQATVITIWNSLLISFDSSEWLFLTEEKWWTILIPTGKKDLTGKMFQT